MDYSVNLTDKRTTTGIAKGKPTSMGFGLILIITGSGLLYTDSKFLSGSHKYNLSSKSNNLFVSAMVSHPRDT